MTLRLAARIEFERCSFVGVAGDVCFFGHIPFIDYVLTGWMMLTHLFIHPPSNSGSYSLLFKGVLGPNVALTVSKKPGFDDDKKLWPTTFVIRLMGKRLERNRWLGTVHTVCTQYLSGTHRLCVSFQKRKRPTKKSAREKKKMMKILKKRR